MVIVLLLLLVGVVVVLVPFSPHYYGALLWVLQWTTDPRRKRGVCLLNGLWCTTDRGSTKE